MIARELMTPKPVTVTPKASIAEAWDLMNERDIRHIPVVDNGVLVGMLSDRDLARMNLPRILAVEGIDALRRELTTPVIEVMRADVISVGPDTGLRDVVDLLLEHKVGALPVADPASAQVVGIISYIDVLRQLRDELELAEEA
jgi:acetoin utilization protein AcuB